MARHHGLASSTAGHGMGNRKDAGHTSHTQTHINQDVSLNTNITQAAMIAYFAGSRVELQQFVLWPMGAAADKCCASERGFAKLQYVSSIQQFCGAVPFPQGDRGRQAQADASRRVRFDGEELIAHQSWLESLRVMRH